MPEQRPCRRCACPLLFAPNVKGGKVIPVDARSPTYVVWEDATGKQWAQSARDFLWAAAQAADPRAMLAGVKGVGVSHFATCTHSDVFSKSGKDSK